jgi:AraC family transcriptional regulator, regulatory protein of adaptative response / DNA-3-methyladenine glycosylase II
VRLDPDLCYRALSARDRRFDGLFLVGVTTTGVYCRPVCTARTPGRARCAFFGSAAEAERAGFRACFVCRPELAPGHAPLDAVPRLVARALARIEAGALDEGSLDALAAGLGVTGRHLRRAMEAELGVPPVAIAQTHRLARAKRLLHDSALPLAEVALASGFRSVRRFNAAFRERFGRAPSAVRRDHAAAAGTGLRIRLDFRPPYDWERLLAFVGARGIAGVEHVADGVYARTVRVGAATGVIRVAPEPGRPWLVAEASLSLAGALAPLVARLRAVFDLDAPPDRIAAHLLRDPLLGPLVRRRPGLRLPGAFDPFESAVRAVLGQQVSVAAATTIAGRVAARFGAPLADPPSPALSRLFPTADVLAAVTAADLSAVGLPRARGETLHALARAVASGDVDLHPGADPEVTAARLDALPGIGPWTAQYVTMRALHHPDAFPGDDLGVRKALGLRGPAAEARAEAWRPWRSYAVMHLWESLGDEREERR